FIALASPSRAQFRALETEEVRHALQRPAGAVELWREKRFDIVLGDEWTDHTQGMAVSVRRLESGSAFTELVGELVDEAALMGVLDALYTHGARLLSVDHIGQEESSGISRADPPRSSRCHDASAPRRPRDDTS
ncbi:MAG: hypothetical protein P8049_09910, partial [Gemmatimonadota bacterium]